MRAARTFVDTNVFVYAFDDNEAIKQRTAKKVLAELDNRIVISTQVVQEFFSATTRKLKLPALNMRQAVDGMLTAEVVGITPRLASEAIDLSILHQISIWDASIVQAAISGRCERILTEDLNHGQVIKGIRIENPFQS